MGKCCTPAKCVRNGKHQTPTLNTLQNDAYNSHYHSAEITNNCKYGAQYFPEA
jgi:hypothetical protein